MGRSGLPAVRGAKRPRVEELSGRPAYEVRVVQLPVPGEADVWIMYRHTYVTGEVDVMGIMRP